MSSKGIRFKVWDQRNKPGRTSNKTTAQPFFFHTVLGNNEIVSPSEGYADARTAFKTIESIWFETALAQAHVQAVKMVGPRMQRIKTFIERNPVPYTIDSLLPKAKRTTS